MPPSHKLSFKRFLFALFASANLGKVMGSVDDLSLQAIGFPQSAIDNVKGLVTFASAFRVVLFLFVVVFLAGIYQWTNLLHSWPLGIVAVLAGLVFFAFNNWALSSAQELARPTTVWLGRVDAAEYVSLHQAFHLGTIGIFLLVFLAAIVLKWSLGSNWAAQSSVAFVACISAIALGCICLIYNRQLGAHIMLPIVIYCSCDIYAMLGSDSDVFVAMSLAGMLMAIMRAKLFSGKIIGMKKNMNLLMRVLFAIAKLIFVFSTRGEYRGFIVIILLYAFVASISIRFSVLTATLILWVPLAWVICQAVKPPMLMVSAVVPAFAIWLLVKARKALFEGAFFRPTTH